MALWLFYPPLCDAVEAGIIWEVDVCWAAPCIADDYTLLPLEPGYWLEGLDAGTFIWMTYWAAEELSWPSNVPDPAALIYVLPAKFVRKSLCAASYCLS